MLNCLGLGTILSLTKYLASPGIWPSQNVTESNAMSRPIILKSAWRTRTEVKWMFYLAYVVNVSRYCVAVRSNVMLGINVQYRTSGY